MSSTNVEHTARVEPAVESSPTIVPQVALVQALLRCRVAVLRVSRLASHHRHALIVADDAHSPRGQRGQIPTEHDAGDTDWAHRKVHELVQTYRTGANRASLKSSQFRSNPRLASRVEAVGKRLGVSQDMMRRLPSGNVLQQLVVGAGRMLAMEPASPGRPQTAPSRSPRRPNNRPAPEWAIHGFNKLGATNPVPSEHARVLGLTKDRPDTDPEVQLQSKLYDCCLGAPPSPPPPRTARPRTSGHTRPNPYGRAPAFGSPSWGSSPHSARPMTARTTTSAPSGQRTRIHNVVLPPPRKASAQPCVNPEDRWAVLEERPLAVEAAQCKPVKPRPPADNLRRHKQRLSDMLGARRDAWSNPGHSPPL